MYKSVQETLKVMQSIIPIESSTISSLEEGFEPHNMFDGKFETYWKPKKGAVNNFIQVNFFFAHIVDCIDILFADKADYIISIEYLNTNKTYFVSFGSFLISSNTEKPNRIYLPTTLTKSIKITFLTKEIDGHTYIEPLISELRIFGQVKDNEPESLIKIPSIGCPEGHVKNEDGQCVQYKKYERKHGIWKEDVEKHGQQFYTLELNGDIMTMNFPRPFNLHGYFIRFNYHPIDFQILIGPKNHVQTINVQKEINELEIILNKTINNISKVDMILNTDTLIEVMEYYCYGEYA